MTTLRHPAKITKTYLFKLSIPIFFSNLAIPLAGLVDTGLMGHLGSGNFLAATSISTSVITMIFWSFGFLRMGTVGLVSQSLGKGEYREIVLTTMRSLAIAVLIGLIIFCLSYPILNAIDYFFSPSAETQVLINKYITIRLFSAPSELILYVLTGFYLGLQKTSISSLMVSLFCFINILLSIYFVLILNLDIEGVALGTVLSSYITVIIFLIFTYFFVKKEFNLTPDLKKIFIRKKFSKLFNINFDIFVRTILITFAFLWFTYQSSKLGEDLLAVNAILLQFITFAAFLLDAYAFSTEGVIGFSIGRRVKKSFLTAVINSFQLSVFTGLIISVLYLIFFKSIINLITDLDYLRFLSYGYLIWIVIIPPLASFCYQFDGIYIGASQTVEMRNGMIISVLIFIFTSIKLVENFGNNGLWFSLLIFMMIRSFTLNLYFPRILKRF